MQTMTTGGPTPHTRVTEGRATTVRHDRPLRRLSPRVDQAWRATCLSSLPDDVVAPILAHAVESTLGTGEVFYRGAHHADTSFLAVVVSGLLRLSMTAADGRALTVRYMAHGQLIGATGIALDGPGAQSSGKGVGTLGSEYIVGEAVQPSRLLVLPRSFVAALARRNPQLALSIAHEVAIQSLHDQEMVAANVFSPIRPRVARHLLSLAVREGADLVVTASHQEIANAIGSVREVVSRALCKLQVDGLVERRGRRLVLLDPARIHEATVY